MLKVIVGITEEWNREKKSDIKLKVLLKNRKKKLENVLNFWKKKVKRNLSSSGSMNTCYKFESRGQTKSIW